MRTKRDILELVEQEDVEFIRLQFTDMFGNLKNMSVTVNQLAYVLDKQCMFDGSAMFGNEGGCEDDLYLVPDLDTFAILPWRPQADKVARMLCDVHKVDGSCYENSARCILKRVVREYQELGYTFSVDPECEFFLFHIDENGIPTTVTHEQAGYMDVGPVDLGENSRREIVLCLEEMGFEIEASHHEAAPAQQEIDFKEGEPLQMADAIMTFKTAVRSIARRFGMHATFMPKPKEGVAGSGMHLLFSVYKDGESIFHTLNENGELCQEARWFIGGILKRAKEICAISNPLVNSYKRLLSGFDAPKEIFWTTRNQNGLVKVYDRIGEPVKVELRFPDPSANPYLVLALCLEAGMQGIRLQEEPGEPMTYAEAQRTADSLPQNLREAVHLMKESTFVEKVLGKSFVDIYTDAKMKEWNDYMIQVSEWEVKKYLNYI
ncbi:MAG: glutamine synthetase [Lachnospiraceae bacterium]|nr:glutamine synthetase [Lachnospiraceae bacterium]